MQNAESSMQMQMQIENCRFQLFFLNPQMICLLLALSTIALISAHPNANVESVVVKQLQNDTTFLFSVTISHADESEDEHYCNGWSVYSNDGKETLFSSPGGSRDGLTVHFTAANEPMPSKGVVHIPVIVSEVVVRAHDKQHGFGGAEIVVDLVLAREKGEYNSFVSRKSRLNPL